MFSKSDHQRLITAGWAYRTNDRGWVVYRDPETGLWHTRPEAIAIMDTPAVLARKAS